MDNIVATVGARLRAARLRAGLTVRAAAQQVGVDHTALVRYESGTTQPTLERLAALARLYGTTPAALLASSEAAAALIALFDTADAEQLSHLRVLVDALRDQQE
ncbi:MAG: helix-turn-helix transcriptional regulator [Chloroflexota bacterium]